jgi:hypothetical protein
MNCSSVFLIFKIKKELARLRDFRDEFDSIAEARAEAPASLI